MLAHEDVFVLASHREGLPLSIIEAMRAQLPVIASDVGGVSELVSDGKTGYTFPHANVEILSQRLREVISDANLRSSMGSEGRKLYEEGFTPDQMMKRIYGVYGETIDNHKLHLPRPFLN